MKALKCKTMIIVMEMVAVFVVVTVAAVAWIEAREPCGDEMGLKRGIVEHGMVIPGIFSHVCLVVALSGVPVFRCQSSLCNTDNAYCIRVLR